MICECGFESKNLGSHKLGGYHKAAMNILHYKKDGFKIIKEIPYLGGTYENFKEIYNKEGIYRLYNTRYNNFGRRPNWYHSFGSKQRLTDNNFHKKLQKIAIKVKKLRKIKAKERKKEQQLEKTITETLLKPFPELKNNHILTRLVYHIHVGSVLSPEGREQQAIILNHGHARTFVKDDNNYFSVNRFFLTDFQQVQRILDDALPVSRSVLSAFPFIRQGDFIFRRYEGGQDLVWKDEKERPLFNTRHKATGGMASLPDDSIIFKKGTKITAPDHPTIILQYDASVSRIVDPGVGD